MPDGSFARAEEYAGAFGGCGWGLQVEGLDRWRLASTCACLLACLLAWCRQEMAVGNVVTKLWIRDGSGDSDLAQHHNAEADSYSSHYSLDHSLEV